jgi:hypothetical protein
MSFMGAAVINIDRDILIELRFRRIESQFVITSFPDPMGIIFRVEQRITFL